MPQALKKVKRGALIRNGQIPLLCVSEISLFLQFFTVEEGAHSILLEIVVGALIRAGVLIRANTVSFIMKSLKFQDKWMKNRKPANLHLYTMGQGNLSSSGSENSEIKKNQHKVIVASLCLA